MKLVAVLLAIVSATILVWSAPCAAQTFKNSADQVAFDQFRRTSLYAAHFTPAILSAEQNYGHGCHDISLLGLGEVHPDHGPIQMKDGKPESGSWQQKVRVKRCDEEIIHNLWFRAKGGGQYAVTLLIPGSSLVPPNRQAELFQLINSHRLNGKTNDTCQNHQALLATIDDEVEANEPWQEEWTTRHCQQTLRTIIDMIPAVDGSLNFTIHQQK